MPNEWSWHRERGPQRLSPRPRAAADPEGILPLWPNRSRSNPLSGPRPRRPARRRRRSRSPRSRRLRHRRRLCRPLDRAPSRRARRQDGGARGAGAGLGRLRPQWRPGHPRAEIRSGRARREVPGARRGARRLRGPHRRRGVRPDRQAPDGRAACAGGLDPGRAYARRDRGGAPPRRAMGEARRGGRVPRQGGDRAPSRHGPVPRRLDRPPRRRDPAARLCARPRQGGARGRRRDPWAEPRHGARPQRRALRRSPRSAGRR